MPINNYKGEDTFVAFLDIWGFKKLMKINKGEKAWKALDCLYNAGYEFLQNRSNNYQVEGIFISDCGILFVRNNPDSPDPVNELKSILQVIKRINERMKDNNFILTASIAYGEFKYQRRIEFPGIGKSPIYGNAYVLAFSDNENGKPRIKAGQCRIVKEKLPTEIEKVLENNYNQDKILQMVTKRNGDNNHYYYYWMIDSPDEIKKDEIKKFEQRYRNAQKGKGDLKYTEILGVLKDNGG